MRVAIGLDRLRRRRFDPHLADEPPDAEALLWPAADEQLHAATQPARVELVVSAVAGAGLSAEGLVAAGFPNVRLGDGGDGTLQTAKWRAFKATTAPLVVFAQAHGHHPEQAVLGAPPVFLFEPHQPEQCEWKPEVLLDISEVWDQKRRAFETMAAQEHLWEYYTRVALQRGVQASRNSNLKIQYAEGYQRVFPQVTGELA